MTEAVQPGYQQTQPGVAGSFAYTFTVTSHFAGTAKNFGNRLHDATTITVSSDHTAGSIYGQTVIVTAIVSAATTNVKTPTGSVQFQIDGTNFGPAITVTGGSVSFNVATLFAESHQITATYVSNSSDFSDISTTVAYVQNVAPAPLTINATTDTKTYDSTTTSSAIPTYSGQQGGDTVTGLHESYDSANAGARTLSVNTGYTVNDGNGGNNYTVALNTAAGQINKASLTINAKSDTKTYDSTTTSSAIPTYTGQQGGDTVSGLHESYDSANAGARTLSVNAGYTVNDGNSGNNYTVALNTAAGQINKAALTINAKSDTKTYDSTTTSSAIPTYTGQQGGDTVSGLHESYDSANAGARTLSVNTGYIVNDGNGGNNYTVTLNTAAGQINKAALTINAKSDTKTYDSTTTSSAIPTYTGQQGGDTVSGLHESYDSANSGRAR